MILIPEIPFSYESICAKVREREAAGKQFSLIIAAEGAREKGGEFVTSAAQVANREARLGGIAGVVAAEVERADRQGGPRLRAGPLAAGRRPHELRPRRCARSSASRPWS